MIYEVGKQFPVKCPKPGADFSIIQPIDGGAFDLIMYMNNPSFDEKIQAKTGTLKYGVFENSFVPFFIVSFDSFSFDASMNVFKLPSDKREDWIASQPNAVTLFLIDSSTNIIKAIRFIGIETDAISAFKQTCKKQLHQYTSAHEVEASINRICNSQTTKQMFDSIITFKL